MPDRAAEVDLLRDGDNPDVTLAPVGKHIDTFPEAAGEPVEFPDDDRRDFSGEDGGLQLLKRFALKAGGAVAVLEPLHGLMPVPLEPGLKLGPLAVGLLPLGGGSPGCSKIIPTSRW